MIVAAVFGRAPDASLIRKCGVMAVVLATGDTIRVMLPPTHHLVLLAV